MGKLNMLGKNLINTKNNNLMLEVSFHLSPFGSDTLHLTLKSERMKRKKKKNQPSNWTRNSLTSFSSS